MDDLVRQATTVDLAAVRRVRTLRRCPDRLREVPVIPPARNHVPVQMRRHVAEAREIDLVRLVKGANRLLDAKQHVHQPYPFLFAEISHFAHMAVEDDAAEAGVVGVTDGHDATLAAIDAVYVNPTPDSTVEADDELVW